MVQKRARAHALAMSFPPQERTSLRTAVLRQERPLHNRSLRESRTCYFGVEMAVERY